MITKTKWLRYHFTQSDWIDVRITKDLQKNEIIKFSVNLSVKVSEKVYSAIRYDNAHGYTHIDRYWEVDKEILDGLDNLSVIRLARKDILTNWMEYRSKVVKQILEGFDE